LVQQLCKLLYSDKFWYKDAHENIPSPACLIVFVKLKTENQLIRFEAVSGWNTVMHPTVSLIRQLTNGEFALIHVSEPKVRTHAYVLFHNCQ